jgi:hypothetical protein
MHGKYIKVQDKHKSILVLVQPMHNNFVLKH